MLNGKGPFRLVLDTGANSSAITPSVADRLGITPQQSGKVKLIGVTGTAEVQTARIESMTIGDLSLGAAAIPIVADVFGGAEGVIGPKGFEDKRIFIDFRNDMIQIAHSSGRAAEKGFTRVPITTDRRQLLMFDIRVGGVKTKAILSTGGQQTLGNESLREALLKRAREGKEQDVVGVTLDVAQGQSIAVPPIAIGELLIRNVQITFADPVIFTQWQLTREPAMLVGMDVIGSLDALVIDYKMREMHIRPRR
jgi:predicted aspartyl protease